MILTGLLGTTYLIHLARVVAERAGIEPTLTALNGLYARDAGILPAPILVPLACHSSGMRPWFGSTFGRHAEALLTTRRDLEHYRFDPALATAAQRQALYKIQSMFPLTAEDRIGR